ncbi:hypothetical protein EGW08_021631 [Elysia chlorotica]|uniref:FYVE-type domain-containing protein n=1 Tax=Elysia chlorotica TaxID=188477 RepID=A0A3S0ZAQ0_ELYCH|nr:hypothetical protein EGW08_021631 [Elysia chlorotica]
MRSLRQEPHLALAQQVTPGYFQQIDHLTSSQATAEYVFYLKEITKIHWKPSEGRSACSNKSCRRQFTLIERPHHCRKCGEVFCAKCVAYQRRLNRLAHFDPDGDLEKVSLNWGWHEPIIFTIFLYIFGQLLEL